MSIPPLSFYDREQAKALLEGAVQLAGNGLWHVASLQMDRGAKGQPRWQVTLTSDGQRLDLLIEPRIPSQPAYGTTKLLQVSYQGGGSLDPDHEGLLRAFVTALKELEGAFSGLEVEDTSSIAAIMTAGGAGGETALAKPQDAFRMPMAPELLRKEHWPEPADGWRLLEVYSEGNEAICVRVEERALGVELDIVLRPWSKQRRAFMQTDTANIDYRLRSGSIDEHRAGELAAKLIPTFQQRFPQVFRLFPHLSWSEERHQAAKADGTASENLPATLQEVEFSPEGIDGWLGPQLRVGEAFVGPWVLEEIAHGAAAQKFADVQSFHLHFREIGTGELVRVTLQQGHSAHHPFATTPNFQLQLHAYHDAAGTKADPPVAALSLLSHLTVLLRLKDSPDVVVKVPEHGALRLTAEVETGFDDGDEFRYLNLALDVPCGQNCVFCMNPDFLDMRDPSLEQLPVFERQLKDGRSRGLNGVRMNGVEPLGYSGLWELLELVRQTGYESVQVFTLGHRFADRDFCERFLGLMPDDFTIYFPLYGASAAVHDAVTQTPGSFERVEAGLTNLLEMTEHRHVFVAVVIVRQNLAELSQLSDMLTDQEVAYRFHLPFPMTGSKHDRYVECMPRFTEIAGAIAGTEAVSHLDDFPPCVQFWHEKATGLRTLNWWNLPVNPMLHGVAYAKDPQLVLGTAEDNFVAATYPCPHKYACALAAHCPKEVYRLYVDRYGWDEVKPVALRDLAKHDWHEPPLGPWNAEAQKRNGS